jgi:hypothetical protein
MTHKCLLSLVACSLAVLSIELQAIERTILLVDDHDVLYRAGTERVLHSATRHSASPVIAEEKPWEVAIGWTSIYRHPESGLYQLWYQAYSGNVAQQKSQQSVICYAESLDGLKFDKPNLGLHAFNGDTNNNIVLVGNGGYGDRYGAAAIVDPRDPEPARRYKLAYYDWARDGEREYAGLHVAFSPDGIHWTKHPGLLNHTAYGGRGQQPPFADEPAYTETRLADGRVRKSWPIPFSMSDAVDVFYDEPRGVFAICGKVWLNGPDGGLAWKHAMGRIESRDFLAWSKPQLLLTPDDRDPPQLEFHTSPVFFYAGRYLCLNQRLDRRPGGGIDIELMISRDGLSWERPFRDIPFLSRGAAGQFDSGSLFTNATPVILDDEIRFYYGAYSSTAIGGGEDIRGRQQQSGVGLAIVPRDRLVGVRPVAKSDQPTLKRPLEHVGQVTLKPLDLAGCREILVNANAAAGEIRAELLTEDGYRVRGFDKQSSVPMRGDSLRHRALWNAATLGELSPGRYMLRLHLERPEVFSVTFK